ncbi:MAG: tetratricopeptide repeat protein, partial [Candidatus Omnitrophica bacterium]|nr:tetratricopeptide repeat protein [Candidatus Omnitrophota bacterium]
LQGLKDKADAENAARDAEYKEVSGKLLALKAQSPSAGSNESARESELASLKTLMAELEVKTKDGEHLRQQLAEESLASSEKSRVTEEQISILEREDASRSKELREKIENFDKVKNENGQKVPAVEGMKKASEEAGLKVLSEKAAIKKIEEDIQQVSQEKTKAEKELVEKMDDLKVRISVLVAQSEKESELLPKDTAEGAENIKARLKRAEEDLVAIRREAEQALLVNKSLKAKYDKGMLEKHFNLAVVYEMNGLYKDSEQEYLECLKIDPNDADVHYNLAILYDDRLNDNKKAQEHYYKFLSYRPIGEPGQRVRDWITRAELEERLGGTVR